MYEVNKFHGGLEKEDIRDRAIHLLWDSGKILRSALLGEEIDSTISLKPPSTDYMSSDIEGLRLWRKRLKEYEAEVGSPYFHIAFKKMRILHEMRDVPKTAHIAGLNAALAVTGKSSELRELVSALDLAKAYFPDKESELTEFFCNRHKQVLESLHDGRWQGALDVARWLAQNPKPQVTMRSASIAGIDSKFIERNKALLSAIFEAVLPEEAKNKAVSPLVSMFEERYGFKRICSDVIIRINGDNFAKGNFCSDKLLFVENKDFMSCPMSFKDLTVVYGGGYGFPQIRDAEFLRDKEIYYWGDIDTHGLQILSEFRKYFPNAVSVLMDKETYMRYAGLAVVEAAPVKTVPANLTKEEAELFRLLLEDARSIGGAHRLEQERIPYEWVVSQIKRVLH